MDVNPLKENALIPSVDKLEGESKSIVPSELQLEKHSSPISSKEPGK
jgi:hypothetical protein